MILINQVKTPITFQKKEKLTTAELLDSIEVLTGKAAKILQIPPAQISKVHIMKHSIDARKKPQLFQVYTLGVTMKEPQKEAGIVKRCKNANVILSEQKAYQLPKAGETPLHDRPVIIGMGPAGLFCGYLLAKQGYRPIILERGYDVDTRTKQVEEFWNGGQLLPNSNVQFGEGGAGTFSDGKLNTLVKDKYGRNKEVLRLLVEAGASDEILYESKPHIGTDVLKKVVKNMREEILACGGEVRFGAQVTALDIVNGQIRGVEVNQEEKLSTEVVVLAIGHSARDTFYELQRTGISMEAKAFAVGMRVEHPQSLINEAMYGKEHGNQLPAAPYKLTAKTRSGRGVYSFCMCPGGYVVNASSEEGRLAVNGMSYSDRNSQKANSAIIVTVTPQDYESEDALAGVAFQRKLEERAYQAGKGQVPVQYYADYCKNRPSAETVADKPCIKGKYTYTNLRGILPDECEEALMQGMKHFDSVIQGFTGQHALLAGVESRTSSPVRIHRDETLQCPTVKGLYPCGEGAGYAGGITSAAMDGMVIAEQIIREYRA